MTQNPVSLLSSPFWENINEQWIGGTLLLLALLVVCSQALALARWQSRRMYLVALALLLLAGILLAPFADSRSPREFQRWLLLPQTLGTLSALQILWTAITVFAGVQIELEEKKRGIFHFMKNATVRFLAVAPSPILLLLLFWVEQNILIAETGIKPEIAAIQTAGGVMIVLTVLFIAAVHWLSRYRRIGLQLLVGCVLCMTCALLPCLSQGLSRAEGSFVTQNTGQTVLLLGGMAVVVGVGLFWPRTRSLRALRLKHKR